MSKAEERIKELELLSLFAELKPEEKEELKTLKKARKKATIKDKVLTTVGSVAIPKKPKSFAEEYQFPEDPTTLPDEEVGRLMLILSGWRGYALFKLALSELESASRKSLFEYHLSETIRQITDKAKKTKASLHQEAFERNSDLTVQKLKLEESQAERDIWNRLQEIYESQISTLSREIARRKSGEHWDRRAENVT